MDPEADVKGSVGGASDQGADHGDAVRSHAGEMHSLEGEKGVARTVASGVTGDEGSPGDDIGGGHFVEQLLGGGDVGSRGVEVEERVADVEVRGEAESERQGVNHAAARQVAAGKGLEDERESVSVGRDGGAEHVGEEEEGREGRGRGREEEKGAEEGIAEEDVGAVEAGEEGEGGGEAAEGEADIDEGGGDGGVGVEAVEEDLGLDEGELGGGGARADGMQDPMGGRGQRLPPRRRRRQL